MLISKPLVQAGDTINRADRINCYYQKGETKSYRYITQNPSDRWIQPCCPSRQSVDTHSGCRDLTLNQPTDIATLVRNDLANT